MSVLDAPAAPEVALEPVLAPERLEDGARVDALIARAFGPGRFGKTAERLREHNLPDLAMSFVAWRGGDLVGCVRQWPVRIGETPALLLGPFAVEESWRKRGLGAALIRRAREAAAQAGHRLILLVGDAPFFEPLGFSVALARGVRLPGPVDPRRVLVGELVPGAAAGLAGLAGVPPL